MRALQWKLRKGIEPNRLGSGARAASQSAEQGGPVSYMDAPVPPAAAAQLPRELQGGLHLPGRRSSGSEAPADAPRAGAGQFLPRTSAAAPRRTSSGDDVSAPPGGGSGAPWAQANPAADLAFPGAGAPFSSQPPGRRPAAAASSQAGNGAALERSHIPHEVRGRMPNLGNL